MKDEMNIAISFDSRYAEQATVMLFSLLSSCSQDDLRIFVFIGDVEEPIQRRIESELSRFDNFQITWIKIDTSLLTCFPMRKGHVNEYAFSRLYMGDILNNTERVIYLDCDMLVLSSLRELWQTDLRGKTIGAVIDPSPFVTPSILGIPEESGYFNSGMLLMDVVKWNKNNYSKLVGEKLHELGGLAAMWDQDGLNAVLYDDWQELDAKWNIQSHHFAEARKKGIKNFKDHFDPAVVHFTGNLKPWNYKSTHPYKKEYYRILKQTDFYRQHRPENKTLTNVVKRTVRNILVHAQILKQ